MSDETEADLMAMLLADEPGDTIEVMGDRRLLVRAAPRGVLLDIDESAALNEWVVVECGGRRHSSGRLVTLDGGR